MARATEPWKNDGKIKQVFPEGEESATVRQCRVFSWYILLQEFGRWCRRLFTQKWWTYASWKKALKEGKGGCPECGSDLCID